MDDEHCGLDSLEVESIIGFNGCVPGGLQVHPDKEHLIYPLGNNVIIENLNDHKQTILSKHTNNVTCIAIDPTGQYIATGQVNYMGFPAPIILWDYVTKQPIMEKKLHKVKVEALVFSADSSYLISLGGRDCGAVVVWDLAKGEALCGSPAQVESAGITHCLAASKVNREVFVTGGNNTLRVWHLDVANRKIRPTNVTLGGGLKREITCIEVADHTPNYPYMFCGTTTGDILAINMNSYQMQFHVPIKENFSLGVTALSIVNYHDSTFDFLVGTGDGLVGRYEMKVSIDKRHYVNGTWKHHAGVKPWTDSKLKKRSAITSIAKRGSGHMFFVGTGNSQVYKFNYAELSASLIKTCHSSPVNDLIFAFGFSDLLVSCSLGEIRVWNSGIGTELCRYSVPNMTCNAICISRDGRSIFSAWDDGKIRVIGFKQEKGSVQLYEKYTVRDAHNKGVTAIAITCCGSRLVTGGGEGQVRLWQICEDHIPSRSHADLVSNMKEHKGKVTSIQIHPSDKSCVSASTDGSTIIWDLETSTRSQIVQANTLFKCVCFGGNGLHILTSGTDHKIGYWEVRDGCALRELEGSKTGAINTMDISNDGNAYLTGGEDRLLKLWKYNEGQVTHVGVGHSDQITKARICPNKRLIASGGEDGAIHIWRFPSGL